MADTFRIRRAAPDPAVAEVLADVAKMLVHRRARRRGLGEALMRAAQAAARESGSVPPD